MEYPEIDVKLDKVDTWKINIINDTTSKVNIITFTLTGKDTIELKSIFRFLNIWYIFHLFLIEVKS